MSARRRPTLLGLFGHFMLLSLLAVGGAITTASDMNRYLVAEHGWITDGQFTASIAIAQAAPGPNVLFVAVLGWNVGGPLGALATMVGTLLPSTLLTLAVTRWTAQHRDARGVRAFTTGMAPLTLGLLLATGWVLAEPFVPTRVGAGGSRYRRARRDAAHAAESDVAGGLGAVAGALGLAG